MMSILEYANDVNKTVDEIKMFCDRLNIKYDDENTMLTEDDIVLLDGEIETNSDNDVLDDEVLDEKVEKMISDAKIDIDNTTNKQKFKPKSERIENNKVKFQKERKELYKHREKLMQNDDRNEENVILYKEDMTVSDLANLLSVNSTEIIKKLMKLGIMANINYSLSLEIVELIALDYDKEVKREESKDISNF